MEVSGQLHATGKNPDAYSVGGCVGARDNPGGFGEESISKNSNNFLKNSNNFLKNSNNFSKNSNNFLKNSNNFSKNSNNFF